MCRCGCMGCGGGCMWFMCGRVRDINLMTLLSITSGDRAAGVFHVVGQAEPASWEAQVCVLCVGVCVCVCV